MLLVELLRQAQSDVDCIRCEKGKGVGSVLLQNAVSGASEWSIRGTQRKNNLETLESKV